MAPDRQERRRIVIDGSNIATEGRTVPSLAQLDEAIRSFLEEYQGFASDDVTVVVDASFGHRIDPSEVPAFEQALDHGEVITPPAGALGRGDGFILRIAEKSGALVLSNDSFQEFHAERPWLFEPGRLIGGKPVPGVGWVFTPRTPVRGARSRTATSRSKRDGAAAELEASEDSGATKSVAKRKATKAAKAESPAKATPAAKATKAEPAPKAQRATKAAKSEKVDKASKAEKAETSEKPAKKASSSTKAAKTTKMAAAAKPTRSKKSTSNGATADADPVIGAKAASPKTNADKPAKRTAAKGAAKGAAKDSEDHAPRPRAPRAPKAAKAGAAAKSTNAVKAPKPAPESGNGQASGATAANAASALNKPVTFLNFVANHPVGSTFEGTVVSFTSHGAHIDVDGMVCHVPLRGLGDPPPTRARQVLSKGETRPFVLVSLDAARRRAELALPGLGPD